jgi:F-type H+-transporting ATPase subunit a
MFMLKKNTVLITAVLSFLFLLSGITSYSQHTEDHGESHEHHDDHKQDEKFNPGEMIMKHIGDEYGWHITTINHNHISIPLPVILYSEHSGFHMFMSSKFHHGHDAYKGFHIAYGDENPNKGKVVELVNGEEIRPYDISITKNTLSLFISIIFISWIFISIAKSYQKREGRAPKGLQSFLEPLILFIRDDIAKAAIGKKKYLKFTPFLLTVFFFIFFNNLLGLVPFFPGGANLTGNITITLVLALFTFVITTISGNKYYWKHIFNTPGVPWWLKLPVPLMPFVEFLGIFIKPFVLMVRLFANITAGHIVVLGFFSLIFIFGEMGGTAAGVGGGVFTVLFTVFLTFLEFLVAFIQAYVFTLLSALYFGMAIEEHH